MNLRRSRKFLVLKTHLLPLRVSNSKRMLASLPNIFSYINKFRILKQDCAQKLRLKVESFQQKVETVEEK